MATWIKDTVKANGINISYLRTGGDKPPVVLVHGMTDNGACWTRLTRDLEGEYDLILPDARGHGQSSVPEHGYSFADYAADLVGLIEALALDRPALVGHSLGGVSCAMAAAQAPALVRAAILEDPAFVSGDRWGERAQDWPKEHLASLGMSLEELVADTQTNNPYWSPDTFEYWARAKYEVSMHIFDLFNTPAPDGSDVVARIGVPVLLITGDVERGVIISPERAAKFQALNPRLRVANIDGVGHCIRYEQPDRYAAIVRDFLHEVFAD